MSKLNRVTFNSLYNNSSGGRFPTNTTQQIGSDDLRSLSEDLKDSLFFTLDDAFTGAKGVTPLIASVAELRSVATISLPTESHILFREFPSGYLRVFKLGSSSSADNGVNIIRPNDYTVSSPKVWHLADVVPQFSYPNINTIAKLKAIPTFELVNPGQCIMFRDAGSSNVLRVYELFIGSDEESSPNVIRPNDYTTSTNEKVWKIAEFGAAFALADGNCTTANGNAVDLGGPLNKNTVITGPFNFTLGTGVSKIGAIEFNGTGNAWFFTDGSGQFVAKEEILFQSGAAGDDAATLRCTNPLGGVLLRSLGTVKIRMDGVTPPGAQYAEDYSANYTARSLVDKQYVDRVLFDHYTNVGNSGASETDLYSDTITAGKLANNGDKLIAEYGGAFVNSDTDTRQLKVYFGGTVIFDTGTITLRSAWSLSVLIIRVGPAAVRYRITMSDQGSSFSMYTKCDELTGLILSNTNVLKITGTSAGVGAASNDIIAQTGYIEFKPVAL